MKLLSEIRRQEHIEKVVRRAKRAARVGPINYGRCPPHLLGPFVHDFTLDGGRRRMRKHWTCTELATLRELWPDRSAGEIVAVLGHSAESIRNKAKQLGIRKRDRLPRRPWTDEEIACLRDRYADAPTKDLARELGRPLAQVYAKAAKLGLEKSEAYLASPHACRLRRGDNVGAATRFEKGHVPANKGLRRPGWFRGRMRETQFKKGQRGIRWMPIGAEVRDGDGYLIRKVTEEGRGRQRWKFVHVILWEEAYGPVPPGYAVKFIDGDRRNVVLSNLCLVSRSDLGRLNVIWNRYPRELAEVIVLRGALVRKLDRRNQREEQDRRSA